MPEIDGTPDITPQSEVSADDDEVAEDAVTESNIDEGRNQKKCGNAKRKNSMVIVNVFLAMNLLITVM